GRQMARRWTCASKGAHSRFAIAISSRTMAKAACVTEPAEPRRTGRKSASLVRFPPGSLDSAYRASASPDVTRLSTAAWQVDAETGEPIISRVCLGSTAEILRLLERVTFTPESRLSEFATVHLFA